MKGYLDEVAGVAAASVIEKYTGVLAAADVFTESTTFWVMESIRLDLGYGSQVHPLMASSPVREPLVDQLLTPQNVATRSLRSIYAPSGSPSPVSSSTDGE